MNQEPAASSPNVGPGDRLRTAPSTAAPSSAAGRTPDATNATLIAREDLTDTLSIVRVRPDSGRVPAFVPGQFVRLGVPRGPHPEIGPGGRVRLIRRAYSIASSPLETAFLEFFVVRIDEGALTPRLWEIEPPGRLWMDEQAKGEFHLDLAPPGCNLVMVSTGTGIAPFVSMLRTFRGQGRWRRFILINGVRYACDLGYREELEAAARTDATVGYVPIASREPEGSRWTGLRGRVQSVLDDAVLERVAGVRLDPADCHVFLCGNPEMILSVQALLEARGFVTDDRNRPGNIHFERYW